METVFDLFLWGMAGALALAPLGAAFGAIVRAVAQVHHLAPEATPQQAARSGAAAGSLFLAVFGFLLGGLTGWSFPDPAEGLAVLAVIVGGTFVLMLLSALFGSTAYFATWLGVRASGLLLSLGIVLTVGWFAALRAGHRPTVVAAVEGVIALAGLIGVVVCRLRSPVGQHVFEPWIDESDVQAAERCSPRPDNTNGAPFDDADDS